MKNTKEWVISDTHFGHKNIIKYCERPFKSVSEMNETLIRNWNNKIKNGHLVYMLGDFALGSPTEVASIINRLNGYKYLIMGNHDLHKNPIWWERVGFDKVSEHPIIVEQRYLLSHYPMPTADFVNVFGHIHNKTLTHKLGTRVYNACVEVNDYSPIDFDDIKRKFYG